MKTAIIALYNYQTYGQEAWLDHGAAMTYAISKDFDVSFIDMKALSGREELKERLGGFDLVCFGLKSAFYSLGMEVVDIGKELGAKVMVGGVHTTAAPDELRENEKIDYIFFGESEITFPSFLKNPDAFNREIVGEAPADLNSLPFIDRDIFREPIEDACGWAGHKTMTSVISSRGCPYRCAFCYPLAKNHFGEKLRRRSVQNLLSEITLLKERYRPDFLMIHDDTFLIQPSWIEEFIEEYPRIGVPFWASARADGVCRHPNLIRGLSRVGLKILSIGFESGSQRILNMIAKGTTVEQNLESARIAKEAGAIIYANYMLGFPTETKEEIMATMRMVDKIEAEIPSFAFFSPYPGSQLGDECIKSGLSLLERNQYNRFPQEEKIKGIDYGYLKRALGGFRE